MSVGTLQETKWFGDGIYEVDDSVLLTAGHPAPAVGAPLHRVEDVALVPDCPGLAAWKHGGLHGAQNFYQLVWSLRDTLVSCMLCPAVCTNSSC